MANERKRSVSVGAGEATEIKTMYEARLRAYLKDSGENVDTLILTGITVNIAKWSEVVDDLNAPAPVKTTETVKGGDAKAPAAPKPK